jgi:hypothetical protein
MFNIFYDAPVLIVTSSVSDIPYAVEDCALAAENLTSAARTGHWSLLIGFAQPRLATAERKAARVTWSYGPIASMLSGTQNHPTNGRTKAARGSLD